MDHDRRFFDTFMLVLGGLIGFTIALFFIANAIADANLDVHNRENPMAMKELDKRLAPVGQVQTAAASAAQTSVASTATPTPAGEPIKLAAAAAPKADGKALYEQTCSACHGMGIAGAPKFGDKAAWGPRIKQGMPTLYEHALKGFQGKAGMMPAKGGRGDLSDDAVKAAVDYMAAAGK